MKCIFVDVDDVELEFFLFEDEIDEKKLKQLGIPNIWVSYPEDLTKKFELVSKGVYEQGDFECGTLHLGEPTQNATLSAHYRADTKSIIVRIKGRIFCSNYIDFDNFSLSNTDPLKIEEGYIDIITLNNHKNKLIKKPKDEYGMSLGLEVLAANTDYDGSSYKISFKVYIEDGSFQDGKIVS